MDWVVTHTADSTYDAEFRSDLPRKLPNASPAELGDSITIRGNGDHIKITVLSVIDPATIHDLGIAAMMAKALGQENDEPRDLRTIAVKVKMRNLEDASAPGIVHGLCGGILFDSEGHEYASTGASIEHYSPLWVPKRGTPPKVMCDAFTIPLGAKPARYVLAISDRGRVPAGEWRLDRSLQAAIESGPDFGVKEQLRLLETGVEAWNAWRAKHRKMEVHLGSAQLCNRDLKNIDLSFADLDHANFAGSDLKYANFSKARASSALFPKAKVDSADFTGCDLKHASFIGAYAAGAHFDDAVLTHANLDEVQALAAQFRNADLRGVRGREATLTDCDFKGAKLDEADFTGALLDGAILTGLVLQGTKLNGACLRGTDLRSATLHAVQAYGANLQSADLTGATVANSDLSLVTLVNAKLGDATIIDTRVFGISAWDIKGTLKRQDEIIITPKDQARVTVNDLEVANFVYLILNNEKIRNAIETIGRKAVLILGRFTDRKHVLDAIRKEVKRLDFLPIVFDFERPTDRDFSETVMTLAGMSRFIVADITAPKSVGLELQATVPNYMVPFVPLIEKMSGLSQCLRTCGRNIGTGCWTH